MGKLRRNLRASALQLLVILHLKVLGSFRQLPSNLSPPFPLGEQGTACSRSLRVNNGKGDLDTIGRLS